MLTEKYINSKLCFCSLVVQHHTKRNFQVTALDFRFKDSRILVLKCFGFEIGRILGFSVNFEIPSRILGSWNYSLKDYRILWILHS